MSRLGRRSACAWVAALAIGCGSRALGPDDDSGSSGELVDDLGSTSATSSTGGAVDSTTDSSGAPSASEGTTTDDEPTCSTVGDGVCDEPQGTGLCPAGSDRMDCATTCGGESPTEITACDPWQQDCPDFHKCNAYASDGNAWDATGCFPVACDAVPVGGSCQADGASGIDDCEAGAMCWGLDADGIGTCVGLCQGMPQDPICPAPGDACVIANNDALNLCLPACDPSAPDCPEGQSCYAIDDAFVCAPTVPPSPGSQGQPCGQIATCDPGLQCVAQRALVGCTDVGCCTTECNLTDPGADEACAALEDSYSCVPLNPEDDVGVCATG